MRLAVLRAFRAVMGCAARYAMTQYSEQPDWIVQIKTDRCHDAASPATRKAAVERTSISCSRFSLGSRLIFISIPPGTLGGGCYAYYYNLVGPNHKDSFRYFRARQGMEFSGKCPDFRGAMVWGRVRKRLRSNLVKRFSHILGRIGRKASRDRFGRFVPSAAARYPAVVQSPVSGLPAGQWITCKGP